MKPPWEECHKDLCARLMYAFSGCAINEATLLSMKHWIYGDIQLLYSLGFMCRCVEIENILVSYDGTGSLDIKIDTMDLRDWIAKAYIRRGP